jgi:hypothetical protein
MIIHGFVLEEVTKPAHEHHMQVLPSPGKPASVPFIGTKQLQHITASSQFYNMTIKSLPLKRV